MDKAILRPRRTVIDLETYGTGPNAAIASIGAVDFKVSKELEIESMFYRNIEQSKNKSLGRDYDASTLDWWSKQSKEVQDALFVNQQPLVNVLMDFIDWIDPKSIVYVQGLDFDIPILRSTLKQCGFDIPWKYNNARCSRTLSLELGFDIKSFRDPSKHHNALEDAKCQAKMVNHILFLIENAS